VTGGEEDGMTGQRTFRALGGVDQGEAPPAGAAADALREEFERVLSLKGSLRGEARTGVSPTGRRTTASAEAKLRTLVASVEGASRFAIKLDLLSPGQVRALWAEAMEAGLFDGWDAGQSAYEVDGEAPGEGTEGTEGAEAAGRAGAAATGTDVKGGEGAGAGEG
jgi:hypothetical protein